MNEDGDNLEEYKDAALYDYEHREFEPYGPFYLSLARRVGRSVLELGCGTGRITIPLAKHGFNVTGIDIVPGMIELAKRKGLDLPIRWVEADVRTFQLHEKFQLIIEPGATFQHMLNRADQVAMLERISEHLAPEGIFALSVVFPRPELMVTDDSEQPWYSYSNDRGLEIQVSGTDHYDHLNQVKTETAFRRWLDDKGREIVRPAILRQRYTFPQEMELLLEYAGFQVQERYGDWDFSPLTDTSNYLIYLCRKGP